MNKKIAKFIPHRYLYIYIFFNQPKQRDHKYQYIHPQKLQNQIFANYTTKNSRSLYANKGINKSEQRENQRIKKIRRFKTVNESMKSQSGDDVF